MKLVDFKPLIADEPDYPRFGVIAGDKIVEMGESAKGTLSGYIQKGAPRFAEIRTFPNSIAQGAIAIIMSGHERRFLNVKDVQFTAPILHPTSLRDFYAFEGHIATASANRGREVPKEWYQFPVFYFSNTSSIYGPDDTIPYPSYSNALDYELEIACVIGKAGRDIPADKAEEHIFGYMIFNDWSARDVQQQEMRVGLGPAKGKDFANSFGPYLVTPDELADRHTGRPGVYDLEMIARVNGVEKSRGNWKDLYWSFGQMIARASQDVTLQPGDVFGSGTVGTGCLLELTKGDGPWLQPGDVVELEVERLGILCNTIGEKPTKSDYR